MVYEFFLVSVACRLHAGGGPNDMAGTGLPALMLFNTPNTQSELVVDILF